MEGELLKRTRKGKEVAFSFFKNIQIQSRIQKYVNSSLKFHFLIQEIYTGHEYLSTSTEGLRYEFVRNACQTTTERDAQFLTF
jgi:hypothetical protein